MVNISKISNKKFKQISCGTSHVIGQDLKGKIYGWGNNKNFELGSIIGTTLKET